jgi:membrane protein
MRGLNVSKRLRWLGGIFYQSALEWMEDNAFRLSAALAYYTVFSLAPILVLATAIAGIVLGDDAARGELTVQLERMVGPEAAAAIAAMVSGARQESSGLPATILGTALLIAAATVAFAELKSALNQVWNATPKPAASWVQWLRTRVASFGMVLCVGFLLLVSLLVNTAIAAVSKYFVDYLPVPPWILSYGYMLGSLFLTTLLFALIFKVLPDTHVEWRDVWVGAFVTAILFGIGRWLIGLYLGRTSVASTFGASASLAVVLVWTYYSSMILFYGAEFTEVFSRSLGSRCAKSPSAVDVPPRPRAKAA